MPCGLHRWVVEGFHKLTVVFVLVVYLIDEMPTFIILVEECSAFTS